VPVHPSAPCREKGSASPSRGCGRVRHRPPLLSPAERPRIGNGFRRFSKGWKIAALGLAAAGAAAGEPVAVTIESAVARALRENRELIRLAAAHEAALIERSTADAEFDLRLRPDGAIASSGGAQTRQLGLALLRKTAWGAQLEFGARAIQTDGDAGDSDRRALRAVVSQPLFRYAGREVNREAVARAESRVRAALRQLELAKSDLALRVAQAYYDIVRIEELARIEQSALDRLAALRRLSDIRVRQGRAAAVDALRIAAQEGEAAARVRGALEQAAARRLELAELLGLAPDTPLELAPPPLEVAPAAALADALAAARANRLDLAQLEDDLAEVRRGLRIARRRTQPDLRLVASIEQSGGGPGPLDGGLDETTWTIGLQSDGDWGGRRERLAVRRAELDEATALDDLIRARWTAERQVRERHLALERALAETAPARRNRDIAEHRLRLARRLFEMGRGDPFAVSDAEQQFQQAEAAWLSARTEAVLADFRLRRAAGVLIETPDDLKPRGDRSP